MPTTPPLDAEYAAWPIWPSNAATDAVLTMTPRSSPSGSVLAMRSAASRSTLNVPIRLTSTTFVEPVQRERPVLAERLDRVADAGAVDVDAQRAHLLGDIERRPTPARVGDVGLDELGAITELLDDVLTLEVDHHDRCAPVEQALGGRQAQAGSTSGDDGYGVFDLHRSCSFRVRPTGRLGQTQSRRTASVSAPGTPGGFGADGHAAREPRRGRRVQVAVLAVEGVALGDVRFGLDLGERQHRRDAGVGAGEHRGPVVAVVGGERLGEPRPQFGPAAHVVLVGQVGRVEAEPCQQLGVELRLDRTRPRRSGRRRSRRCRSTGAPVSSMLTPRSSLHMPMPRNAHIICDSTLEPSTIAASTTWPLPERLPLPQRREHADEQEHRPAAEVADEVQRRHRPLAGPADRVQHAVERDVVDVVAGLLAARAVWPHPVIRRVDQPLVDLGAVLGAEAEALGDAGPEALDQHVGLGDQPQHQLAALVALEVRGHRPPVAQQVVAAGLGRRSGPLAGPFDADDVGAEVAEDHRGVRTGADAGQLDDAQSLQWSSHAQPPFSVSLS